MSIGIKALGNCNSTVFIDLSSGAGNERQLHQLWTMLLFLEPIYSTK
jgi:hypothetical protein